MWFTVKNKQPKVLTMADVLDIDNAEEFEVDDEGDRKFLLFSISVLCLSA